MEQHLAKLLQPLDIEFKTLQSNDGRIFYLPFNFLITLNKLFLIKKRQKIEQNSKKESNKTFFEKTITIFGLWV